MFATYTADAAGNAKSKCYTDAEKLGFDAVNEDTGKGRQGTFVVDVTNPRSPRTVSFVEVPQGSHNQTVHPSGNYLYNSNSDLMTSFQPAIEVFDISNLAAPRKTGELALPTRPGPGHRVARHHLRQERRPRLLGRAVAGRDHQHDQPRPAVDRLQLRGPGDQRLAPVRPGQDRSP